MLRGVLTLTLIAVSGLAQAQTSHDASHPASPPQAAEWSVAVDAAVFFGRNMQVRHFADYDAWESQNWAMITARRQFGRNQLTLTSMVSLEPFTIGGQGSPQLFQTGESYQGIPLVNFQHPHDLLAGLGATYSTTRGQLTYRVGADLIGSPTLGPVPFMHRTSAQSNPQVPLTHHFLDSTHSTPGVVRAGVQAGQMTIEGSAFRGEEPDEDRLNIERPRLDSWAARAWWQHGPWQAQFSAGRLRQPEWYEPYDVTRLTASIGFDGRIGSRPLSALVAWGQNRHFSINKPSSDGFLLEWDFRAATRSTFYGRAEAASKVLFGLGLHTRADVHPHWYVQLGALTLGYLHDIRQGAAGTFSVGTDATVYTMPDDMRTYYDSSRSFHFFLKWRPGAAEPHRH
jgi:hypothetical protein